MFTVIGGFFATPSPYVSPKRCHVPTLWSWNHGEYGHPRLHSAALWSHIHSSIQFPCRHKVTQKVDASMGHRFDQSSRSHPYSVSFLVLGQICIVSLDVFTKIWAIDCKFSPIKYHFFSGWNLATSCGSIPISSDIEKWCLHTEIQRISLLHWSKLQPTTLSFNPPECHSLSGLSTDLSPDAL